MAAMNMVEYVSSLHVGASSGYMQQNDGSYLRIQFVSLCLFIGELSLLVLRDIKGLLSELCCLHCLVNLQACGSPIKLYMCGVKLAILCKKIQ